MAFVSELIGKSVTDVSGNPVGKLVDLIASFSRVFPHPVIVAVCVKTGRQEINIPYADIAVLIAPAIPLKKTIQEISPFQPAENDFFLARDILDQQIIDTNGIRVVRVNDIELARINGSFFAANVDVGGFGLLRRLGMAGMANRLASIFSKRFNSNMIAWNNVELLGRDQPMRLKVPGESMADLHPADIAEIISDLTRSQTGKLLETLDTKTLADTLEEVETDFQASIVEHMSDEKVADVLEEMAPDEAADLLAELPEDRSHDLLNLMERDEAADVRKLLTYPEDTAGGIMTTEYISVPPTLTAEQTISILRQNAQEAETIFYVYVTDQDSHLLGVFSLSDLVIAQPETPITSFMHKRPTKVNLDASQDEVAQLIAKYNLLAIPVTDENNCLHGIVTSDDALDKIIPTKWKKRLPRFFY